MSCRHSLRPLLVVAFAVVMCSPAFAQAEHTDNDSEYGRHPEHDTPSRCERPAPHDTRPHAMGNGVCPRPFPNFNPERLLPPPPPEHANSRFESRLFAMPLPPDLTPQQQQTALALIREAEPNLTVLHTQLRQTLIELHNLSFASDTPPDALLRLGRKLMQIRNDVLCELQRLSGELEREAGFNPGWGTRVRAFRMPDLTPQRLSETGD